MMKFAGKFAVVALCATALTAIGHNAQAGTLDLLGGGVLSATSPNPLYGTAPPDNNVINSPGVTSTPSGLFDPTNPAVPANTPWIQGTSATTTLPSYFVSWFFAGSESGYEVTFNAGPVTNTELNQNNNCIGCGASPQLAGPVFLGTTAGNTTTIPFSLTWAQGGISNGNTTVPGTSVASLIFSYINPQFNSDGFFTGQWNLTTTPTAWFAFGLNDNGGGDDNHDDYVGFALVSENAPGGPGITPIPAALPLFGSVLGGGFLFGRLRKRRQAKASA